MSVTGIKESPAKNTANMCPIIIELKEFKSIASINCQRQKKRKH